MKTRWTGIVAVAVAVALSGGAVAQAKPPEGRGPGKDVGRHGRDDGDDARRGGGHGPDERGGKPDERGKGGGGAKGTSCDEASSVIQAFVDATCPCDGVDDGAGGTIAWKNHGQYVRCVARAAREAARTAGVKRRCAKQVVPCAARSTCGKKRAVACVVGSAGVCTGGVCSNDAGLACAEDADCDTRACEIASAERCAEAGGVGAAGSCCQPPASASGAFLD